MAQPAEDLQARDNAFRSELQDRIGSGEYSLPVLPTQVTKVLDLCYSVDSTAAQLSEVIHKDQTMAGHVLRIANSSTYMPGAPVVSLQQAITRLGLGVIGEIAITLSVRETAFDVTGYESEVTYLWQHSAATGAFCKEVARQLRKSVDSALLCGLLQNVGKPVLMKLIQEVETSRGFRLDVPTFLGFVDEFHAEMGAQMAEKWSLPAVVAETIRYHHDYAAAPEHPDEARMACLAERLATHVLDPDELPEEELRSHTAFADLHFYPEDVDLLLDSSDKVRDFVEAVS